VAVQGPEPGGRVVQLEAEECGVGAKPRAADPIRG
jgi:hypothetical protein